MKIALSVLLLLLLAGNAFGQSCPLGGTVAGGKGCSISDYTVGGALADTDAIAMCQKSGGCLATSPTITYTQQPMSGLASYFKGKLSATPPLTFNSTSGAFGLNIDTTLSVVSGALHVVGTGTGPTIPNAQLLSGNGSVLGSVAVGSNLTLSGTFPTQTLNASVTGGGGGTVTQVNLATGFTTTVGTCNPGTQAITTTGTINGQNCVAIHTLNYPLVTADTGVLVVMSGPGLTATVPPASAAQQGVSYEIGSDGLNSFTVSSASPMWGCSPAGGLPGVTAMVVSPGSDIILTNDSQTTPGYKCTQTAAAARFLEVSWGPGQDLSRAWIPFSLAPSIHTRIINAIWCRPEVLAGGAATIALHWAGDTVALSSGTDPTATATCNAGTGATAATRQVLPPNATAANLVIPAGGTIGILGAGAGWPASVGSGVLTISYRGD